MLHIRTFDGRMFDQQFSDTLFTQELIKLTLRRVLTCANLLERNMVSRCLVHLAAYINGLLCAP